MSAPARSPAPPSPRPAFSRADIIGAGSAGLLHGLSLRAAGVQIAQVYDPDTDRARALAAVLAARVTRDLCDVVSGTADIVCVASPPPYHVFQAKLVAQAGPHRRLVFVEKPVATCAADLQALGALPGIVPVVQWRRGRGAVALRAAVATGAFGPSPRLRFALSWPRDDAYFRARSRATWGCGALLSIGIHAVDLGLWVLGARSRADLRHVEGRETWTRTNVDVATGATLRLQTTSGATMELDLTTDGAGPERTRLTVEGEGNRAHVLAGEDDPTAAALVFAGPRADSLRELAARAGGAQGPPLLVPYLHGALRAARGGTPSPALLGVSDVALAHEIIFDVAGQSAQDRSHPRLTR